MSETTRPPVFWLIERNPTGQVGGAEWMRWRGHDELTWTKDWQEADWYDWQMAAVRDLRLPVLRDLGCFVSEHSIMTSAPPLLSAPAPTGPSELSDADLKTYAFWAHHGKQFFADYSAAQRAGASVAEPMQYIRHLAHATDRLLSRFTALRARLAAMEAENKRLRKSESGWEGAFRTVRSLVEEQRAQLATVRAATIEECAKVADKANELWRREARETMSTPSSEVYGASAQTAWAVARDIRALLAVAPPTGGGGT